MGLIIRLNLQSVTDNAPDVDQAVLIGDGYIGTIGFQISSDVVACAAFGA